jgi:excisionase family DNA binding protein
MPATRKKPAGRSASRPDAARNGLVSEVFTLAEAAVYLRVSEKDVLDLVRSGTLPGRCIGGEWRFLKSAIQEWLTTRLPTLQSRKEAQLALAGKYKDDPDLKRICQEAYRRRGRSVPA